MNRYRISFNGRKAGAQGICYPITAERTAETAKAAIVALYDEYEHILLPVAKEI